MRYTDGFTLIEQLTIVILVVIISQIAMTQYDLFLKKIEAITVNAEIKNLMVSGRNLALQSHCALTICGSSTGSSCDNNWNSGALLVQDHNRNGLIDGSDRILQFLPLNIRSADLTWHGFSGNRITIEAFGTTYASNGTFNYCSKDHNPQLHRQIVINRGGRVRSSIDTNHDGIHEDSQGIPIVCP